MSRETAATPASGAARAQLDRSFFDRSAIEVAPDLLGRVLVRLTPAGPIELRLTEVEAYAGSEDPGSHAYRGRTQRNAVMFGPPGHVYVYLIYGLHRCMNLVCSPAGTASAVLLRAGEIVGGADLVRPRRATARSDAELAKGPARLATALDVRRDLDGADACPVPGAPHRQFRLLAGEPPPVPDIASGPRIGVAGDGATAPWRFWIAGNPTVSRYRAHSPRRRSPR